MPECLVGLQPAIQFQLMIHVPSWSIGPSGRHISRRSVDDEVIQIGLEIKIRSAAAAGRFEETAELQHTNGRR